MAETYYDSFLLDTVLSVVQNLHDRSKVSYNMFTKTPQGIKGDYVISKTQVKTEQGVGNVDKDETLPTQRPGEHVDCKIALKWAYAQFELFGQDQVLSDTNKSQEAVKNILTYKTEDLMRTFLKDQNRQMWGDASGKLTETVGSGSASKTITVKSDKHLEENMLIDVHATSIQEDRIIESINRDTHVVTVDANTTWQTGKAISRANAKDKELSGFKTFLTPITSPTSWGTYANVDRDLYEKFRAVYLHNGGTPESLDLDKLDELVFKCIQKGASVDFNSGKVLGALFCGMDMYRAIIKLRKLKSIPTEYTKINLGYQAPSYETPQGPVPVVLDIDAWDGSIVYIDLGKTTYRRPRPIEWKSGTGGSILRVVENKDKERATLRLYNQMLNVNPQTSGALVDQKFPT